MALTFTSSDHPYTLSDSQRVKKWIKSVILEENKELGSITVVWCSDSYLLGVNREYLSHDYYTDIITFDYTEGVVLSGDLMISLDTVRNNSEDLGELFHVELHRVILHGVLHLCGYKDKTDDDQREMSFKEDYYLAKYEI